MSKDCKDCEYFNGYDYSDGTPLCEYEDGYEGCPYNEYGSIKEDKFKIVLDMPEITTFIEHTVSNTVHSAVYNMIQIEIQKIIKGEIEAKARAYTDEVLKNAINAEVNSYMENEITIGGGWRGPERKLSRNDYLSECISKVLDEKVKPDLVNTIVKDYCTREISNRIDRLKTDINNGIKKEFDETTRKALSDNVVSMLMCGDTYKRLSDSMGRFLK